jgi:hypothetical protein
MFDARLDRAIADTTNFILAGAFQCRFMIRQGLNSLLRRWFYEKRLCTEFLGGCQAVFVQRPLIDCAAR